MGVIHYAEMWLNTYLVVLSEWWVGLQQGLHRHWSIENSLPPDSECSFHQVSHRMLVGLDFFVLKGQHLDMPHPHHPLSEGELECVAAEV